MPKTLTFGFFGVLILIGAFACDAPSTDPVATQPCEAEEWAKTVRHARLDETTINQFYAQMPAEEEINPTSERRGTDLLVTWTFPDDSFIMARFQSVPGDMTLNTVSVECE